MGWRVTATPLTCRSSTLHEMHQSTTASASASNRVPISHPEPRVHQFSRRWPAAGDICGESTASEQLAVSPLEVRGGAPPRGRRLWPWSFTEYYEMVLRAAWTALGVRKAVRANQLHDDRFFR